MQQQPQPQPRSTKCPTGCRGENAAIPSNIWWQGGTASWSRDPREPRGSVYTAVPVQRRQSHGTTSRQRERDREGGVKERGRDKDSGERESGSEGEETERQRDRESNRVDPRPAAEGQWLDHPGPSADLDPLTSQRCGCPTNNSAPYVNSETHHTLHPPHPQPHPTSSPGAASDPWKWPNSS